MGRFYKGYIKIRGKNMKRFKRKIRLYKKVLLIIILLVDIMVILS